jgi:hypothetical protein
MRFHGEPELPRISKAMRGLKMEIKAWRDANAQAKAAATKLSGGRRVTKCMEHCHPPRASKRLMKAAPGLTANVNISRACPRGNHALRGSSEAGYTPM